MSHAGARADLSWHADDQHLSPSPDSRPMTLGTPELVGRAPILEAVVRRASQGRSTVLTGPTGIGRSRLLVEVATRLERTGIRVVRLTATASASSVPFGVFLGLLDRMTILRIGAEEALG